MPQMPLEPLLVKVASVEPLLVKLAPEGVMAVQWELTADRIPPSVSREVNSEAAVRPALWLASEGHLGRQARVLKACPI